MSYDDGGFWDAYKVYAEETAEAHIELAKLCRHIYGAAIGYYPDVLDLGCGGELLALELVTHSDYVGVDASAEAIGRARVELEGWDGDLVQADYATMDLTDLVRRSNGSLLVTSLFSAECCMSPTEHEALYRRVLGLGADAVLAAGFYYNGKEGLDTVREVGGLISWQTLPSLPLMDGETRLTRAVPSTLFGPDVVEVWRVIVR